MKRGPEVDAIRARLRGGYRSKTRSPIGVVKHDLWYMLREYDRMAAELAEIKNRGDRHGTNQERGEQAEGTQVEDAEEGGARARG